MIRRLLILALCGLCLGQMKQTRLMPRTSSPTAQQISRAMVGQMSPRETAQVGDWSIKWSPCGWPDPAASYLVEFRGMDGGAVPKTNSVLVSVIWKGPFIQSVAVKGFGVCPVK